MVCAEFNDAEREKDPPMLESAHRVRAIDPWVNLDSKWDTPPDWLVRVQEEYFGLKDVNLQLSMDQMLEMMNHAGVEKSVLSIYPDKVPDTTLEYVRKHPDRFALAVEVEPHKLMPEVCKLEKLANELPVVLARVVPFHSNQPPTHPHYYPFYAKCMELDLPITINTGICGPVRPSGDCQNPIHLDQVCYDFPDLKVCMAHGADPWWDVAIRLMIKYKNLRLMTSAYSPKYFPPQLLHYMKTRGKDKIMFASDFPILQPAPLIAQALQLGLSEDILDRFLYRNADEFFFSGRIPK